MNHSKLSVRTLTMLALLTAMSIIFARVLTVSTGFLRFNLGALPTHLAAVWFGPAGGFAVGAVADLIGGTLSGYSINPLITLGAGSVGLVSGLLFQKLSSLRLGLRLQISILAGHLVGSVVINSREGRPDGHARHDHQLAGAPHFLWIPVAGAGGPHPQRHRAERGQHRAGPHPAGE